MAIPQETILEIKYKNDIESVIAPYVDLKRRGKNLVGLCPFHNEKTPSFTVYPENGSFYCFGCGAGGDVFTFTKLINNLDYIEAVKLLAEKSGVVIEENSYDSSLTKQKQVILEINREAAKFFHSYLMSEQGKWGLNYLTGRGLSISTIKHFGLGAAPDDWSQLCNYLRRKGFNNEDMVLANVASKSQKGTYYDRFRNRIMFPLIDLRGNVIAFSGRRRPDDTESAKYVNTSDTLVYKKSLNLFGMNFAKNHCEERVILVEGNMDAVSLHQAGFTNAIALFGTALTTEQVKLLSRYTKEVVLALDSDAAGQKAVLRSLETAKNSGLNMKILSIPDGKDPDEFILKNGAAKFNQLLESAVGEMDYRLLIAAEKIDLNDDESRIKYLKEATQTLSESDDNISVDFYAGKLSAKYGVSKETILNSINENRKNRKKKEQKKEFSDIISPKFSRNDPNPQKRENMRSCSAEEKIISILLKHPNYINSVTEKLTPDNFSTDLTKLIYNRIIECNNQHIEVDFSVLGDGFSPTEMGYLVTLQNSIGTSENVTALINDCIRVINEEADKKSQSNLKDMSVEDWAQMLKELADKKNKGE